MKRMRIFFASLALATSFIHAAVTADNPSADERGLTYLATVQNADGSWGMGAGEVYTTAFVILAYLNHGETPAFPEYGTNVERGLKWLLRQSPTGELARVAVTHVLTAAYRMTRIPVLGREASRQRSAIDANELSEPAATIFRITLPPDAPFGTRVSTNDALRQFVSQPAGRPPLSDYLQTLAVFEKGGSAWKDFNNRALDALIATQAADGSFPRGDTSSVVEATAFALLRLCVYFRYWICYLDIGYPKYEDLKEKQDIPVEIVI